MFIAGFDPGYVESASLGRLIFWHERFFAFSERRHGALEPLITNAVKQIR